MARISVKYDPKKHLDIITILASEGWSMERISEKIGICRSTLKKWMFIYDDALKAYNKGRDFHVVLEVDEALLKNAIGYDYIETKKEMIPIRDPDTGDIMIDEDGNERYKIVGKDETQKFITPNQRAIEWVQKNRDSKRYNDTSRMDINAEGANLPPIQLTINGKIAEVAGKEKPKV